MNTTKFRGQILDGPRKGEWVYGYLLNFTGDDGNMGCYIFEDNSSEFYSIPEMLIEVDPKTVGQYIRDNDKDENEIYEGDIVRGYFASFDFEGNDTGEIKTVVVDDITNIWRALRDVQQSTLEVIGTIHDNPDLLTQ